MTLIGVMALICVISPNSVASRTRCIEVVEDVVVKKFTLAISSADEFLVTCRQTARWRRHGEIVEVAKEDVKTLLVSRQRMTHRFH